jgi:hypothetical protein
MTVASEPINITDLKRLLAEIVLGTWKTRESEDGTGIVNVFDDDIVFDVADDLYPSDAAVIVALVNAAPVLLAILEAGKAWEAACNECLKAADEWTSSSSSASAVRVVNAERDLLAALAKVTR